MGHTRQHYIPKSYLSAWIDPNGEAGLEPYVWVFRKDGSGKKRKAPKNVFRETDVYTLLGPDGERLLELEHGLAELESRYAAIFRQKIAPALPLTPNEREWMCAFMSAMSARTLRQRDHLQSQWGEVLKRIETIRKAQLSPDRTKHKAPRLISAPGPTFSVEDVVELATGPFAPHVVAAMEGQLPIMLQMNLTIGCVDDPIGLVTSDSPCVWFDSEARNRPPAMRAPSLASPTLEISLPLSPKRIALLTWADLPEYATPTESNFVDEYNRMRVSYAAEHIIVAAGVTRPYWFRKGDTRDWGPDDHELNETP